MHVEFDEESVGLGGAGFAWPNHSNAEQQATQSISLLPSHAHGSDVSDSEQESIHERDHDQPEAAPFDQEVCRTVMLYCAPVTIQILGLNKRLSLCSSDVRQRGFPETALPVLRCQGAPAVRHKLPSVLPLIKSAIAVLQNCSADYTPSH